MAVNSVPRQLLRTALQAEQATDLFLGNSTMAAGLDEKAFATAAGPGRRALNLGLGSSSPVEHDLIYREQAKHHGAALYYGFFDTHLTDPPAGDWHTLVGNRAMAYYVDPEVASAYYAADSLVRRFIFRLVSRIPLLVERYTIWARVERLRRSLSEIGMPRKETNRFGRAEDFALLEPDTAEFALRCQKATARHSPLNAPITAIIRRAKKSGAAVFIVEMPMPSGYRQRFYSRAEWVAYRSYLIELVRAAGAEYVPAVDWVGDDGFADSLHLNAAGACAFSSQLGRR